MITSGPEKYGLPHELKQNDEKEFESMNEQIDASNTKEIKIKDTLNEIYNIQAARSTFYKSEN